MCSQESVVGPDPHRAEADVEVGEADGTETEPGKQLVSAGHRRARGVAAPADGAGRNLVLASADQMPQRVAAERVAGEEGRVQRQDQAADVDVEAVGEAESGDRVVGQKDDEQEGKGEEEAVAVLQDERKV